MNDYEELYSYLKDEIKTIADALEDMAIETKNPDFSLFGGELLLILEQAEEMRLKKLEQNKNE